MQTNADLYNVLEKETIQSETVAEGDRQQRLAGPRVLAYLLAADLMVVVGVVIWWLRR